MFTVVLLLLAGSSVFAQAVEKEFVYQGDLRPTNCFPGFDHGYLIVYETGGRITVRPPNGAPAVTIPPREGGSMSSLSNAAVDTDGYIAATVDIGDDGGIALFRPDGTPERFIKTTPYAPMAVRFGPDHSIWTAVHTLSRAPESEPGNEILRNFSREGRLLGAYLPRSQFESKDFLLPGNTGIRLLHVGADRIGLLLYFAAKGREPLWLEMDMSGKVTARIEHSGYFPFALSARGSLYGGDGPGIGIAEYNRATRKWTPLSIPARGHLLGVDGEQLVFLDRSGLAQWVNVGKQPGS